MGERQRFTIRPAATEDADAIAAVHATSWWEAYRHIVPDHDHPMYGVDRRRAMWRANLADGGDGIVIAEDDTGLIGFAAAIRSDTGPDELTMLYLLERAYGSGAGQGLLDAVLDTRPAELWVAEDNPRARAFYQRNGFEPDGDRGTFGPIATVHLVR